MPSEKFENLNVLLVDDSTYMHTLLWSVLHSFGIRNICIADSVFEAVRRLEEFQANLAIVDWMMSPLSGIEFVKHIRHSTIDRFRLLPTIMLTGHADMKNITLAKEIGVNAFLGKPFTPNSLYDQIAHVLDNPHDFSAIVSDTKIAKSVGKPGVAVRH